MNAQKLLPLCSLALLASVAVACTTPEKQAPATGTATATAEVTATATATQTTVTDEAVPPLYVKVSGPTALVPNTDVDLDVEIVRSRPDATPMKLMIAVPSGAQLVKGLATETIVDVSATSLHRLLTVHVGGSIPPTDVVLTVDATGAGIGVHATSAYRFGRPDPKLAQPQPGSGPTLSAKGVKLGKPIKAD